MLKKKSSGPTLGAPTERSMGLFWMASYDLDGFREIVTSDGFRNTFELDDDTWTELEEND